jgi:hypothetical protein
MYRSSDPLYRTSRDPCRAPREGPEADASKGHHLCHPCAPCRPSVPPSSPVVFDVQVWAPGRPSFSVPLCMCACAVL